MYLNYSVVHKTAAIVAAVLVSAGNLAGAATYPWGTDEVPEGVLEDIAKYYFYESSRFAAVRGWEDLKVLTVPVFSLGGEIAGYYGVVYFGNNRLPTLEKLFEASRQGIEAYYKKSELETENYSGRYDYEIGELQKKSTVAWGGDPNTGDPLFWHAFFYVGKEGPRFIRGGDGIPDPIALIYVSERSVREKCAVRNVEFIRFIVSMEGILAEFSTDGKYYFNSPKLLRGGTKVYDKSSVAALDDPALLNYKILEPNLTWEELWIKISEIKNEGSGFRTDGHDVHGHGMYVPNYACNDDLAPMDPGTQERYWGCASPCISDAVMFERYRLSNKYGEEYWPHTPPIEPEYRDQGTGREVMGGMDSSKGTSPIQGQHPLRPIYLDGVAAIAYSYDLMAPWGVDFIYYENIYEDWFSKHFSGEGTFSCINTGCNPDITTEWDTLKTKVTDSANYQAIPLYIHWQGGSDLHAVIVFWCEESGSAKYIYAYDNQPPAPSPYEERVDLETLTPNKEGGFAYISDYPSHGNPPGLFFDYAFYEIYGADIRLSWAVNDKDDKNVARYKIFTLDGSGRKELVGLVPAREGAKGGYEHTLHLNGEDFSRLVIETQFQNGSSFEQGLTEKSITTRRR